MARDRAAALGRYVDLWRELESVRAEAEAARELAEGWRELAEVRAMVAQLAQRSADYWAARALLAEGSPRRVARVA